MTFSQDTDQLKSSVLLHGVLENGVEYSYDVEEENIRCPLIGRYTAGGWLVKGRADKSDEKVTKATKNVTKTTEKGKERVGAGEVEEEAQYLLCQTRGMSVVNRIVGEDEVKREMALPSSSQP